MSDRQRINVVGPFQQWRVTVDGWEVPLLTASPETGGMIHLSLDHRFGLDLSVQDAESIVPFIAHAIAIASGFACHPNRDDDRAQLLRPNSPRCLTKVEL